MIILRVSWFQSVLGTGIISLDAFVYFSDCFKGHVGCEHNVFLLLCGLFVHIPVSSFMLGTKML